MNHCELYSTFSQLHAVRPHNIRRKSDTIILTLFFVQRAMIPSLVGRTRPRDKKALCPPALFASTRLRSTNSKLFGFTQRIIYHSPPNSNGWLLSVRITYLYGGDCIRRALEKYTFGTWRSCMLVHPFLGELRFLARKYRRVCALNLRVGFAYPAPTAAPAPHNTKSSSILAWHGLHFTPHSKSVKITQRAWGRSWYGLREATRGRDRYLYIIISYAKYVQETHSTFS